MGEARRGFRHFRTDRIVWLEKVAEEYPERRATIALLFPR